MVLNWLTHQPLRREWFFEQRSGNCRLMGPFAERLSHTASTWAQAVAPIAEQVVKALWTARQTTDSDRPATRLTQQHRREAQGATIGPVQQPERPPRVCRSCGAMRPRGEMHGQSCDALHSSDRMKAVAVKGRVVAQTPKAQARRTATRLRNAQAEAAWKRSDQPTWLTTRVYDDQIQPRLTQISARRLATTLHISESYAADIRAGRRPHQRHWLALAKLAAVGPPQA